MIRPELLKELSVITDEERKILSGSHELDRTLYMDTGASVINARKLLEAGRLITIRPHTRFIHFPEHTHDYVEVIYMCSGSTTHIINGKKIVLDQGELLFLGQNARQEIYEAGLNDIAVNFIILPQFFERVLVMIGEEETPLRRFVLDSLGKGSYNASYLHFKVNDVLPIQNAVENLLWTLKNNTPNKRQINQATMGLLFILLLNNTDRLVYESQEQAAVFKVIQHIEVNYRTSKLSDIASELYYDYYWLSREIKRETGKTYTELLQEKRLSQATFLLKNTKMSVADIAGAVGYENISYFHRLFLKKFGVTPRQYRDSVWSDSSPLFSDG